MKDLTGKKFGKLIAVEIAGKDKWGRYIWKCRCACGNLSEVRSGNLVSGNSRSCGCEKYKKKHGMAGSRTHLIWGKMLYRCRNEKCDTYKYYGARGIKVCKRWFKFENFLEDMGIAPEGMTIERIDNDGIYCKDNCRWASRDEQQANTRRTKLIKYKGKVYHLAALARKTGTYSQLINQRLVLGWSVEKAVTTPIKRLKRS